MKFILPFAVLAISAVFLGCSAEAPDPSACENPTHAPDAGGAGSTDALNGLPMEALAGKWRFCIPKVWKDLGSVSRLDAAGSSLIATFLLADGGDRSPFFRGPYDPSSRTLLGDFYRPHYIPDGGPTPPSDQWIQYDERAIELTFNAAGNRAQGTISSPGYPVQATAVLGGKEDGDFECPLPP
jgi:hypothetical protein